MQRTTLVAVALSLPPLALPAAPRAAIAQTRGPRFEITVPAALRAEPVTGRVFVFLSRTREPEPRLQGGGFSASVPFFGADVEQLAPGRAAAIDASTLGYPTASLRDVLPGDYYVQALLTVYTRFARADGHVIWAHADQWEGQEFNTSPGSLVSDVRRVHLDAARGYTVRLALARALPPVALPSDTRYVKHVKIQSQLLTKFWGAPIYLGATVLLPKGYDAEPQRLYPTVYEQGHFTLDPPFGFDPDGKPETPEQRARRLQRTAREPGYEFAQAWLADSFPRVVAVTFQHPTPYYDDSYAVNSANNGPYGDAILTELIPYLETHFRLLRDPRARFLIGGSTGGWEALALQVYHPDFFNGAWVLYPDPVDFRRYQLSNVYADTSAFYVRRNDWMRSEIPAARSPDGQPVVTMREESQLEAVRGSHARSGEQLNGWESVFAPVGPDGYPRELWDKRTGTIDHAVAESMRAHDYDIRDYLQRNWATLGPALQGKLKLYVGDDDNYFLNLAVYLLEDFLRGTTNPRSDATFEYGRPTKPHGWQPVTNAEFIRQMDARWRTTGTQTTSRQQQ